LRRFCFSADGVGCSRDAALDFKAARLIAVFPVFSMILVADVLGY
jgi:hypothetical protein